MKLHSTVGKARLYVGDALEVLGMLPPNSVQVCITSPPYFGLRSYDAQAQIWGDGWKGQLGQEPAPQLYVQHLVQIFSGVKRVLRDDGLLWVVIGDSFASGKGTCYNPGGGENSLDSHSKGKAEGIYPLDRGNVSELRQVGLKPLDLIGIPWRLAFALQDDGWFLRSPIVWQ
ncbi:MAG: DNA methyltransferase, partial [Chloroflexota bacterium]|nr:DNA methyltransferase [Chloroflexota bacterium]